MIVQDTPYPRLALTAHIQFMAVGAMVLLAGILLHQTSLIEIGAVQSRIVYWGLTGCWVVIGFECVNVFWGTKAILPLAVSLAGAEGAATWQEQIMTAAQILPSTEVIIAIGVLMYGVFAQKKDAKTKE